MATAQFTAPKRAAKRVVQVPRSNAVIRLDMSDEVRFAIADGQQLRRLFDIVRWYADDGSNSCTLQRICPRCKRMNSVSVTGYPGYPDGKDGLWSCADCAHTLAKIDANRGRVSVRYRGLEQVTVTVADVIETIEHIEAENAKNAWEAQSGGIPYERFSFVAPVGTTGIFNDFDDGPL